jgi:predicted permease
MRFLKRWTKRIRAFTSGARADEEMNEEFALHLELETAKNIRAGMTPAEAQRQAAASFGGVQRFREEVREARFFAWASHGLRDARYVLRGMRHRPGFVAAILLTLGLGIGASVAMFSSANALFLRPLPFANEDRLQMLFETNPEFNWTQAQAAPANFLDWREQVEAFEDVAAFSEFAARATFSQDGEARLFSGAEVTGNFFDVLGVRPALGRAFRWEETWSGSDAVVVLSHGLWEREFNSDPAIVGRSLQFGATTFEVIGVMPSDFAFPIEGVDLWKTVGWDPSAREQVWFRRAHFIRVVAKLAPGVSAEQANAEFQVEVARLQREYPETNRVMGAGMMPLRSFLLRDLRTPVLVLMGAVAVLLLLACANVANLAFLRALGRQHEIALRQALGASRARIASLLLVEHGLLGIVGGLLGVALSWAVVHALGFSSFGVPAATTLAFDSRVAGFATGVTVVCALLIGAAPLWLALRHGRGALKAGERGTSAGVRSVRLVGGLVALEVALAVLLVTGAGLMARTAYSLRNVDVGFATENVLAFQFTVPGSRYATRDAALSVYDRLLEALEARPSVVRAGTVGALPLAGTSWSSQFKAEGWPADRVGLEILHRRADRGYFEALGIPLVRGRFLEPSDRGGAPLVVVVNETFAREHFPGEDPIGERIAFDRVPNENSNWYSIVGIVGDQSQVSPAQPPRAEVFESRDQDWGRNNWVVLRTTVPPLTLVPLVRETLRELDPLIPIASIRTLDEVRSASMAREESLLGLLAAFGALALILAAIGVYAVAAQSARQRTREIGIRIALGASTADILRLVLRRGFAAVGVGLAVGLGVTLLAARALESVLYGVTATDPLTIAGVALVLFVVGSVASWIPARWATRLDPVRSLKTE